MEGSRLRELCICCTNNEMEKEIEENGIEKAW